MNSISMDYIDSLKSQIQQQQDVLKEVNDMNMRHSSFLNTCCSSPTIIQARQEHYTNSAALVFPIQLVIMSLQQQLILAYEQILEQQGI